MHFQTHPPHPRLTPWVRYYWWLDAPEGLAEPTLPLAPDGTFELVVQLGEPPLQHTGDGWIPQAREMLVGEIQRPTRIRSGRAVACAGVHFAPGGVAAFVAGPATILRDRMTPLDSLDRPFPVLADCIDPAAGLASAAPVFDRVLLDRLRSKTPDRRVLGLIERIEHTGGLESVGRLAASAGVSTRHLDRLLKPALGLPPKRFGRVVRFHRALGKLLEGDLDAAMAGYSDQPHLLRDVREFASAPPRRLVAEIGSLNRLFQRPTGETTEPEPSLDV